VVNGSHRREKKTSKLFNPFAEELCGQVPDSTKADVDRAVQAARKAFDGWAMAAPAERAAIIQSIAAKMSEHIKEIWQIISMEMGMPVKMLWSLVLKICY
jgi:aldehyde dehydrogenase (NAD+)